MRIAFISYFDPLFENEEAILRKYDRDDNSLYLFPLYSKNTSFSDIKNIIKLSFKNAIVDDSLFINKNIDGKFDKIFLIDGKNEIEVKDLKNIQKLHNNYIDFINMVNYEINDRTFDYIEENSLYFIKRIKDLYDNEKRYKHAISVGKLAKQIALNNRLPNPNQFLIAGILHDIGKKHDKTDSIEIMNRYYNEYLEIGEWSYHQFVGEFIVKKEFPLINKEILDAIKFHATGNKNFTQLQMIIYAADKIDPLRGYDSKYMIDECMKDYLNGFKFVLSENMKYLNSQNKEARNILTDECTGQYL